MAHRMRRDSLDSLAGHGVLTGLAALGLGVYRALTRSDDSSEAPTRPSLPVS